MFPIPSLQSCVAQARAAFQAATPGLNAWLWPNNIGPTAKVLGGEVWQLYNRLDFIGKQAFALYSTGKYLNAIGAEYDIIRKVAQPAAGVIVVTTTAAAAAAAGALFQRGDGALFAATAPASVASAGSMNVTVAAILPGAAGTTADGTPMTIVSGVTGAGATGATAAVDAAGLVGGADVEPDGQPATSDLATYRGRILFRKRNPTQGGAPSDYVQWATAVPGCTRCYVEKLWMGPGTVRVFPLFDGTAQGGVPDPSHLGLVKAAIIPLEPATAAVTIAAATPQTVTINVSNLSPNTPETRAAVVAEVNDAFTRRGKVAGVSTPYANMPYLAVPYAFLAAWSIEAVSSAAGVLGADVAAVDTVIADGCVPVPNVIFS